MPLMSAAKLSGIISRPGPTPVLFEMRNTTGMKMAVTAVELIVAPRPQTTTIRRTISRISLRPAFTISQSPSCRATPVRTRPSPITNSAAIRTMFGSLKPASASPMREHARERQCREHDQRDGVQAGLVDREHHDRGRKQS